MVAQIFRNSHELYAAMLNRIETGVTRFRGRYRCEEACLPVMIMHAGAPPHKANVKPHARTAESDNRSAHTELDCERKTDVTQPDDPDFLVVEIYELIPSTLPPCPCTNGDAQHIVKYPTSTPALGAAIASGGGRVGPALLAVNCL